MKHPIVPSRATVAPMRALRALPQDSGANSRKRTQESGQVYVCPTRVSTHARADWCRKQAKIGLVRPAATVRGSREEKGDLAVSKQQFARTGSDDWPTVGASSETWNVGAGG